MKKIIFAFALTVVLAVIIFSLANCRGDEAQMGDVKVIMTGRSTMSLWFKHWNWPRLLRWKATYRSWPIPWQTKQKDGVFLVYKELSHPGAIPEGGLWGQGMISAFRKALEEEKPDVAFFKFCFVDFQVKESNLEERFDSLSRTTMDAYMLCQQQGVRLVLGNSLPLAIPTPQAVILQGRFNKWLKDYASDKTDVLVFDLYGPLVDEKGSLKRDLWKSKSDHHPADKAFGLFDKEFFSETKAWILDNPGSG